MTEKIFDENPRWSRSRLLAELERLLEVDRVIVIPIEPGDVTGHADGVVSFADRATVVVNVYRRVDGDFRRVLVRRLRAADLNVVEMPYCPLSGSSEGLPSAVGNYVNFLQINRLLVVPRYGLPQDDEARKVLGEVSHGSRVDALNCRAVANYGGALNCITSSLKNSIPSMEAFSTSFRDHLPRLG
jgi:agmatine/peptidylarginine deiminase